MASSGGIQGTRMLRTRTLIAAALVAVLVPTLLAGCGGSDVDASALANTKAPAQLLRNSVASRVPKTDVQKLGEADDLSVGCGDNGVMRSWRSSQLMFIQPVQAYKIRQLLLDLTGVLAVEGWKSVEDTPSGNIHEAKLTSTKTSSTILLTATGAADDQGNGASMEIVVTGPCVKTDGPNSDEVKHLENRG